MMPQRPGSLVFLIPGFPEDEEDATCLPAVQNYVAAFADAHPDLHTHVIAFQYPFTRRIYRWKRVTVHALAGGNRRGLRRLGAWLRAARAFFSIYRQTDVRALHSFWLTECTWVGRWLSRLFRIRHLASIGGQDARADNPYAKRLNLDGVTLTAGSAFAAEIFSKHTGRKVDHLIPLGLDTTHLQTLAAPPERDLDVLGVGSLIPLKDYATFIEVIVRLVPVFPKLRACIIGEGPLREALHQQIVEKGIQQHLTLAGRLPRDEVFRSMLRSKVFLHPARYESQGYVFLEALFAGLPVVCLDVGYTGESDRVFRCQSPQEMADAVAEQLRHPPDFRRESVLAVSDTVRAFAPLYDLG